MIGLAAYAGARIPHGFGPIEWVAGANATNGDGDIELDIPAHAAGDLIIAWAHGGPTLFDPPALPSGWTNILYSGLRTFALATRVYCVRDTSNTINTLTLPASTSNVGFMIYRNASGAGVSVMGPENLGGTNGATPSLGALTAGSWVVAGLDLNQGDDTIADPGALTPRIHRLATYGGGTGSVTDTNGIVTSYAGGDTFTWSMSAVWATFAFEILNG